MNLFIFFALPLATILLAIVLQKVLRSPLLVALTFFAIYLIVAFVAFPSNLAEALIAAIIYTIIAYITAYIVMVICKIRRRFCSNRNENDNIGSNRCRCSCGNDNNGDNGNVENNLLTISCSCGNSDQRNDLLTIDSTCLANDMENDNCNTRSDNGMIGVPEMNYTSQTKITRNRPVALGNNIVNRSNMQRKFCRRW